MKSIAKLSTPPMLPTTTAVRYAPIIPSKIGIILIIPLPKMLKIITRTSAITASHQFFVQLFTADGASPKPIAMIIGPVTTGGKSFIILLIPTALINAARMR